MYMCTCKFIGYTLYICIYIYTSCVAYMCKASAFTVIYMYMSMR